MILSKPAIPGKNRQKSEKMAENPQKIVEIAVFPLTLPR
jgi:hypothetical protein